jgi:hypothetical protein
VLALALSVTGCGSNSSSSGGVGTTSAADSTGGYAADDYADESGDEAAQEAWDNQEGDNWDLFNDGYLAGWEAGCDLAFDGSPDGYLYVEGDQYSADDCYDLAPYDASDADIPYEVPVDPNGEGETLGETDGCNAAFDELSYDGSLYHGEDSFDSSVCP